MSLRDIQALLARLYTNEALREAFFADPAAFQAQHHLSDELLHYLQAIAQDDLRFFAQSLRRKRLHAIRQLLPASSRALHASLEDLFTRFSAAFTPQGTRKHHQDALAFSRALLAPQAALLPPDAPPWLPDLLRYEAALLKAHDPSSRFLLRRFRYPVHTLAHALLHKIPIPTPTKRFYLFLWYRLTPHQPLSFYKISF